MIYRVAVDSSRLIMIIIYQIVIAKCDINLFFFLYLLRVAPLRTTKIPKLLEQS